MHKILPELDLTEIRASLKREKNYSDAELNMIEAQYRAFLKVASDSDFAARPNTQIDDMWHTHLMHTAKYIADCVLLFGRFIHHAPDTPASSTAEEIERRKNALATRDAVNALLISEGFEAASFNKAAGHCSEGCNSEYCNGDSIRDGEQGIFGVIVKGQVVTLAQMLPKAFSN